MNTTNTTITRGVAGVAVLALLFAACSSDDDSEPAAEPETAEPDADEPEGGDAGADEPAPAEAAGSSGCAVGETDGDLALYDSDPFEYTSHCIGVVIDGRIVSDQKR